MVQLIKKVCKKCGEEKSLEEFYNCKLNDDGKTGDCKSCRAEYNSNYYKNNAELIKSRAAKHKMLNKHQQLLNNIQWKKNNKLKYNKMRRKSLAKRRRNLGYIEVNDKKPGNVGHHVTRDLVVYIPEWVHRSIGHSQDDLESMNQINELAMQYV